MVKSYLYIAVVIVVIKKKYWLSYLVRLALLRLGTIQIIRWMGQPIFFGVYRIFTTMLRTNQNINFYFIAIKITKSANMHNESEVLNDYSFYSIIIFL